MGEADTLARMERMYRPQIGFYDLTRKPYLLGRDRLIATMPLAPGDLVCEVGCGTGRNLARLARRDPSLRLFGLDASAAMLERAKLRTKAQLARGLAEQLDPAVHFGIAARFDRIVFSYSLSMIPDWRGPSPGRWPRCGRAARSPSSTSATRRAGPLLQAAAPRLAPALRRRSRRWPRHPSPVARCHRRRARRTFGRRRRLRPARTLPQEGLGGFGLQVGDDVSQRRPLQLALECRLGAAEHAGEHALDVATDGTTGARMVMDGEGLGRLDRGPEILERDALGRAGQDRSTRGAAPCSHQPGPSQSRDDSADDHRIGVDQMRDRSRGQALRPRARAGQCGRPSRIGSFRA